MRAPLEFRPSVLALIGGGLLSAGSLAGQMAGVLMLRSGDDKASLGWWLILIMVAFQVGAVHMILEWKNRLVRVTDEWIEITDSLGRLHGPIA